MSYWTKLAQHLLPIVVICIAASSQCNAKITTKERPQIHWDRNVGQVMLSNGRLELLVDLTNGLNPKGLRDTVTGRTYADTDYVWPGGQFPVLVGEPVIKRMPDGSCSVTFFAQLGSLGVQQVFAASAKEQGLITEMISLRNPGSEPLDTSDFACGFGKAINDGANWLKDVADSHMCNVPYRAHPETGELCDYTIPDLTTKQSWYSTARSPIYARKNSTIWGAEGWAWYKGTNTLLITKYNPDAMEWSLLEPIWRNTGDSKTQVLRFGGAGRWKLGDPEAAARLNARGGFTFGATRYEVIDGGWKEAYASFKRFTEGKGHRLPPNYNPPVHWNELYDNQLWWIGDSLENRNKYYKRADMEVEAEKAKDLGCDCLYLDPGWDTSFGSNIWADDRLGSQTDFVAWLKSTYNMSLALHTPLAPWTDGSSYPVEAQRMDKQGNRLGELCCASPAYMDTKIARLVELCSKGAYFLMYDGSWFPGECWDPAHGHSLPLTHQDHLDAILRLSQRLHQRFPKVVIEQHDPMTGPGTTRYTPTYLLHGKPGAFDELWGYEYMIDPMDDIISHRAYSLYYANLAYNIPIYLHVDLRKDNRNAMMFWWYASTCRHMGVGGMHPDAAVWSAHKLAMKAYLRNKRFFTQGTFYGLDATVHAHTLSAVGECVINCFNVTNTQTQRNIRFRLADIGLPSGSVQVEGARHSISGDEIILSPVIPARGHQLIKVRVTKTMVHAKT